MMWRQTVLFRCEDYYEVSLKDCGKLLEERGVNVSGEGRRGCEGRRGDWKRGV